MPDQLLNFLPYETVPLSVSTSSSSVTFKLPASKDMGDVLVYNAGSAPAFLAFGNGSATATLPGTSGTTNSTPVPPAGYVILTKNRDLSLRADTVAAITASGSTTLYITSGMGN